MLKLVRSTIAVLLIPAFAVLAPLANAAPTAQVVGGATVVKLDDGFLNAVTAAGVSIEPDRPARLAGKKAFFPIPGGALDLTSLAGDVLHTGGLSFSSGPVTVELLNFIIDTTTLATSDTSDDRVMITAVVTFNGDVVGRVPVFDLALSQPPVVNRSGRVVIRDVAVTLSSEAADALNNFFQAPNYFAGGTSIGTAQVRTRARR